MVVAPVSNLYTNLGSSSMRIKDTYGGFPHCDVKIQMGHTGLQQRCYTCFRNSILYPGSSQQVVQNV